jgi:predicted transcriptional regulator
MRTLHITSAKQFQKIAKALSIDVRVNIFDILLREKLNINEISERLSIPLSTVTVNVKKMEDADLIETEQLPGNRGSQKLCTTKYDQILFSVSKDQMQRFLPSVITSILPIGHFVDFQATPTCGLASLNQPIGKKDTNKSFYLAEKTQAQLIWIGSGFLEYRFPNEIPNSADLSSIEFSAEMCSEAKGYQNKFPSDITIWINGIEIGTWTSPGDFGGKRGKNTPKWWNNSNTQYGILNHWRITEEGTFLDSTPLSDVSLDKLKLGEKSFISVKIGIKKNAKNQGGLNLFGKGFGNFDQDLVLKVQFFENSSQ